MGQLLLHNHLRTGRQCCRKRVIIMALSALAPRLMSGFIQMSYSSCMGVSGCGCGALEKMRPVLQADAE
jgi:hypothetical protein